jgi:diguanylate cyclase (GGDEF)-like protein
MPAMRQDQARGRSAPPSLRTDSSIACIEGQAGVPANRTEDADELLRQQQEQLFESRHRIIRLEEEVVQLRRAVALEQQDAYFDALTGLPKRRLLMDRLDQALAHSLRLHAQMALLLLDLNGFGRVNDRLGCRAGDELLRQVAGRLRTHLRASDTVCRYGGDEFAVLLLQVHFQDRADEMVRKIRAALAKPYLLQEEHVVRLTSSIGVAVYPADGTSYAELVDRSEAAMVFDKVRFVAPARPAHATARPPA